MAQSDRIDFNRQIHAPSRAEMFEAAAELRPARDAGHDGGDRGGFPFRLLGISYGVGLVLAIAMVGGGFGVLTAVVSAWLGAVAAITITPFIIVLLDEFLGRVKQRAHDETHRRATLEAWGHDSAQEDAEAHAHGVTRPPRGVEPE
jgi:hypothetical protein